jgi:hypothetical protein
MLQQLPDNELLTFQLGFLMCVWGGRINPCATQRNARNATQRNAKGTGDNVLLVGSQNNQQLQVLNVAAERPLNATTVPQ